MWKRWITWKIFHNFPRDIILIKNSTLDFTDKVLNVVLKNGDDRISFIYLAIYTQIWRCLGPFVTIYCQWNWKIHTALFLLSSVFRNSSIIFSTHRSSKLFHLSLNRRGRPLSQHRILEIERNLTINLCNFAINTCSSNRKLTLNHHHKGSTDYYEPNWLHFNKTLILKYHSKKHIQGSYWVRSQLRSCCSCKIVKKLRERRVL